MHFSRKGLLVGSLFVLPLVTLWLIIASTTDRVALSFLLDHDFFLGDGLKTRFIDSELTSQQLHQTWLSESQGGVSRSSDTQIGVQAVETNRLDRSQPNWLRRYCFDLIQEVAFIPIPYERRRGPNFNLPPIYQPERYVGASQVSTCNLDYYIHSVNKAAFADIGIEYQYSQLVWQEFQKAVSASISAQLQNQDWRVAIGDQSEEEPALMLTRTNRLENLREYLDVFFTNDEEIVFELLVVEP